MQEFCIKTSSNICFGYLLESPHWGNSNKYPKHMFCKEVRIKQGFSYIAFYPLRILNNSKFIIMATSLAINAVVVTTVHCMYLMAAILHIIVYCFMYICSWVLLAYCINKVSIVPFIQTLCKTAAKFQIGLSNPPGAVVHTTHIWKAPYREKQENRGTADLWDAGNHNPHNSL